MLCLFTTTFFSVIIRAVFKLSCVLNVAIMPRHSYPKRLETMHAVKLARLVELRGEVVRLTALARRAEDAVDTYRKAIAQERRKRLRAHKRRQESDTEEPPAKRLPIKDKEETGGTEGWEPTGGTWRELEDLWQRLKGKPTPLETTCCGLRRHPSGACSTEAVA